MKRLLMNLMALLLVSATALAETADVGKTLSVRTFQFRNKQADKAAGVIKPLMSADGSMSIQPAANSLIVTDHPENMKRIGEALAQFDRPATPLLLSVRLVGASRGAEAKVDPVL